MEYGYGAVSRPARSRQHSVRVIGHGSARPGVKGVKWSNGSKVSHLPPAAASLTQRTLGNSEQDEDCWTVHADGTNATNLLDMFVCMICHQSYFMRLVFMP